MTRAAGWFFCFVSWFVSSAAGAASAVYRCEAEGKVTYTDRPCSPQAQPEALPPAIIIAPPTNAERELARQHDARIAREKSGRDRADAEWLKNHDGRRAHEARVRKAMLEHRAVKGMTRDEVRRAMGEPQEIARSDSHGSAKESWTYRDFDGTRTVNFKNGEVISTSGRRRKAGR